MGEGLVSLDGCTTGHIKNAILSRHIMVIYQKVPNFRETSSKIREDNTLEIFTIWSQPSHYTPNIKYFQCSCLL